MMYSPRTSDEPDELCAEEIWHQRWQKMGQLSDSISKVADELIENGKIQENFINWTLLTLPEIIATRLGKSIENLRTYAAFYVLVGATTTHADSPTFDLQGDAIQKCAEQLLEELRTENASNSTEEITF